MSILYYLQSFRSKNKPLNHDKQLLNAFINYGSIHIILSNFFYAGITLYTMDVFLKLNILKFTNILEFTN